jgi:acetyltransferase-like isoleucine patch superfamily enzyme
MREARLLGPSRVGPSTLLDQSVIIGYPGKATLLASRDFATSSGAVVGDRCILRAGTVIYEDVVIGDDVQTAHHVVIREGTRIGNGCVFGNSSVVREGARLGSNVRLMELVQVSENADIGDNVFIGPGVMMTAGRYMTGALEAVGRLSSDEARKMEGAFWEGPSVVIERDVRVGSNAILLAGVRLCVGCVVAAGAVVSTNVPPHAMVAGNPARLMKSSTNAG